MREKILILAAVFAFSSAFAGDKDPAYKIRGAAKVAVDGGGVMEEKPDVTMEVKIDNTVVAVTQAMRKAIQAIQSGTITDKDVRHVTETIKDASRSIDQAKESYYKDNEPVKALEHLEKAQGLLSQVDFWTQ